MGMKRFIQYNTQIFLAWLVFIVFRKPMSSDAMKLMENSYKSTDREKRVLSRIKKLNKLDF
jgi:hypothetical protein